MVYTYFQKLNTVWKRFHLWTQNTTPQNVLRAVMAISKRDSAVVWATIGLESRDLHRWLCHRDSVPRLCTFWGISVTVARPVVIWQLMVHSGLPCSHSWLEAPPCPESSGKMLPKLGREGGFQKPSVTKTDNLTAESEEAWDFGSLHTLALFHESKAL